VKHFRPLIALITCAAAVLSAVPAFADVPYVNSGAVTVSGGSPYIYILGLVGQSSCTVASSTGSGTIAVEVSQDGVTWTALNITTPSGTSAMTLALPGVGTSAVAAFANTRAHLTAGAGGSVYFACGAGVGFGTTGTGGSTVTVSNFPNPQNVNLTQVGSATIGAATAAGTSAVGNILGVQGVTGGIPIATTVTFPASIGVTQVTSPWVSSIPAGVNVNNFPATQPVSGTVTANAGTGFPSATAAGTSGTSLTTVQGSVSGVPVPVSGTVTVTPSGVQNVNQLQLGGATLGAATAIGTTASGLVQGIQGTTGGVPVPVSGSVSVSNFPATQPVSGTVAVTQSTSPWIVSGSGTFTVGGTVAVSNFPATQPVSGTVTANAGTGFPAVAAAGSGSAVSVITVQGNAAGTPIPVTLGASPSFNIAQNSSGSTVLTQCDSSAVINVGSVTTAVIINGVSGKKLHICSFSMTVGNAGTTAQFLTGTGGCASGLSNLSGTYYEPGGGTVPSNVHEGSGLGEIFTLPTGQDFCLAVTGVTESVQGHVSYATF
jgi:hypothetical protein